MADGWWVASKPAGVPVFAPHGDAEGACLLRALREEGRLDEVTAWPVGFEGGLAHRLDTSTSGAVVVARDLDALRVLREALSRREIVKRYRFVASREVPWDAHELTHRIGHARGDRRRMVVERGRATPHRGGWFEARTRLRRIDGPLWEAEITTGVMHQIRVHAAFVGLPLRGDALYGGGQPGPDRVPGVPFDLHHFGMVWGAQVVGGTVDWPSWARSTQTGA